MLWKHFQNGTVLINGTVLLDEKQKAENNSSVSLEGNVLNGSKNLVLSHPLSLKLYQELVMKQQN